MGRRSGTVTISHVLVAFLEQKTWRQAALAKRVGVARKTLVRVLNELREAGMPLEQDEDPPQVFWSVPKNWFPGAVAFHDEDLVDLARLLQRLPPGGKQ